MSWDSDDFLEHELNQHYDEINKHELEEKSAIRNVKEVLEDNLEGWLHDKESEIIDELLKFEGISDIDYKSFKQEYKVKITTQVRLEKL